MCGARRLFSNDINPGVATQQCWRGDVPSVIYTTHAPHAQELESSLNEMLSKNGYTDPHIRLHLQSSSSSIVIIGFIFCGRVFISPTMELVGTWNMEIWKHRKRATVRN